MILFAAFHLAAAAPPSIASGIYGNVRMSRKTGDLGGIEIAVHADDAAPFAEVVVCEGWCNEGRRVVLERTAEGFAFDFVEVVEGGEGEVTFRSRMTIRPAGKGIAITSTGDVVQEARLPRLKTAFGLAVAETCRDDCGTKP
ncbi:hypothetical protein [Sphingomonas sp. ID0503]|uniref:hypothetical protein n=1 Tax=Sphingomonas sp. ID0503 TaxID=3399691 RepID=UPI003AFA2223